MGLFSTLSSSDDGPQMSSVNIPTVVQLYTSKPILIDTTPMVNGYTAMTYQAIQVGAFKDEQEPKNRHQNPDLGVWNCRVNKETLLDSLLAKVTSHSRTYCWTVDLSDSTSVEPSISQLQGALVRYLIENPPPEDEQRATSTTTLYQLQATQFGLAVEDKESNITEKNIGEATASIKTSIMICAILPVEKEEVSESAYKTKQANALVIYHLRRFAASINATLCFVQPEDAASENNPSSPMKESQQSQPQSQQQKESSQPAVSFDELSKLWKELALDKAIWETEDKENASDNDNTEGSPVSVATPMYGPGRHQEDFIESVLLRNAHYPGHWEASKDSLWVALPTAREAPQAETGTDNGDEGWLSQVRESIASAAEAPKPVTAPEETKAEEKASETQDVAVSDFFASLLKDP
mmetsp:Transcript_21063/g.51834  ORF Transcript_21063/g.51834 Transcript_21063/m.51834 type:complete len:410 (+) Transcript_21063:133-1362(+)